MTRQEYYERVERALKLGSKMFMCMECKEENSNLGWLAIAFHEEELPVDTYYRLYFKIGTQEFAIEETAFDKYYLPMIEYNSKADVVYRDLDVDITVNNLKYCIIDKFQKYFLQPYENYK